MIYDEFVNKAVEAAQNWKVGDPFDASNNMGPQVDKEQFEKASVTLSMAKARERICSPAASLPVTKATR